jgi:class 3 adenylate cyclase
MTEQRRLAAILVADVVGYSKLIGSDEAGTLAQLEALRTEIIEPQIAKYAGRMFKSVGDGFFIEFASAVQAVSCAKAIQKANDPGRLPLRIGIHVGDVVVQGDDLMGGGVNVAARIEASRTLAASPSHARCTSRCAIGSILASWIRARSSRRTSSGQCRFS